WRVRWLCASRRCGSRILLPRSRSRHVELLGHRRRGHGRRDLEVIAAPSKIDHVGIMRITQNAREVVLTETRAVATQHLPRLDPHGRGTSRALLGGDRADRLAHEAERFVARQPLAAGADTIVDRRLYGDGNRTLRRALRGALRRTIRRAIGGPLIPVAVITTATATTTAATTALFAFLTRGEGRGGRWCGRALDGGRQRDGSLGTLCPGRSDLELTRVELRHRQEPTPRRLGDEARELGHAEVLLVERRVDVLHDLLEAIGAHDVAVALHALDRLAHELPGILPTSRVFAPGSDQAGQR